ncbi:MAG: di-trans,poly-cis-decaprenylcistransferase [Candidatus Nealsonbacteria bacterium]|nr:MAG: di-trans,poly-cis-decaprenylcistransferase [Candidatus Nealsonbacteria bacterium]
MKKTPKHLGIILDGNRRWAKEKGLPVFEGHKKGLEKIKKVVEWCKEKGIKILTLFVFSTENWKRSKKEIDYLMGLVKKAMNVDLKEASKQGIKVRVIGERERLPKIVQKAIEKIERTTKKNKKITLNLALSYGGRGEIVQAVKNIVKKKVSVNKITEDLISKNLWASDLDMIIRTGKEQRISNFLIWQAAYAELYFFTKYWPDFSKRDLNIALLDYSRRQRRFGR